MLNLVKNYTKNISVIVPVITSSHTCGKHVTMFG